MPRNRASSVALTETKMLVRRARRPSGVLSSVRKLSSVGSKSTKGMPMPATVKVSAGLRSEVDTAQ